MTITDKYEDELRRYYELKSRTEKIQIAVLGQPGAGKSSLLSRLTDGAVRFAASPGTDTTRRVQTAAFGQMQINDLPGYGTEQFPVKEWLQRFSPEDFDLYLAVYAGKLTDSDGEVIRHLRQWKTEREHPVFIIRNKADTIWDENKTDAELRDIIFDDFAEKINLGEKEPLRKEDLYFTSCRTGDGIARLKDDIFGTQVGKVIRSKITAAFKARSEEDLRRKKMQCLEDVSAYAWAAAANAVNPVPGVDAAVDLGIFWKMAADIRESFGLTDENAVRGYQVLGPLAKQLSEKVIQFMTKDGIIIVLKTLGVRYARQKFTKYIPFIGWGAAAVTGYLLTRDLGERYVEDCYQLSLEVMRSVVKKSA